MRTAAACRWAVRIARCHTSDLIEPDDADGLLKDEYDAAIGRAGKVFNIVKAMSLRPEVLKQSMEMYQAIMFGPSEPDAGRAGAARHRHLAGTTTATTERSRMQTTSVQRAQTRSWRDTRRTTTGRPTSSRVCGRCATTPSS